MSRFPSEQARYRHMVAARVVPKESRCVQCGVCSYYCPVSIDVRRHVWLGEPVDDSSCISCGECVRRCPRALLRFEPMRPTTRSATFIGRS